MTEPRNGCYDRPALLPTITVQDGWTSDGRRVMKVLPSPFAGDRCKFDRRAADPRCAGCDWVGTNQLEKDLKA